jgi:tetratricopeptide (TPR) repeat protein
VLAFFQDRVLAAGRPGGKEAGGLGLGPGVTVRQAIDAAAAEAARTFDSQPLVEASIRDVLGTTYYHLGDFPAAVRQHERALALRQARLGADHPDALDSLLNLGEVCGRGGQLDRALPLLEEALRRRQATAGPDHLETSRCTLVLAWTYREAGQPDRALPLFEEAFLWRKAALGPTHLRTLVAMGELARTYVLAGKLDRAFPLAEETLKLTATHLGPADHYTLNALTVLAEAHRKAGQPDKALPLAEEAVKRRKAKLGPEYYATPWSLPGLECLAGAYQDAGQPGQAVPLLRECLAICQKEQPDHWKTFHVRALLGGSLLAQKEYGEAGPLLVQGYEGMRQRAARMPAGGVRELAETREWLEQLRRRQTSRDR